MVRMVNSKHYEYHEFLLCSFKQKYSITNAVKI